MYTGYGSERGCVCVCVCVCDRSRVTQTLFGGETQTASSVQTALCLLFRHLLTLFLFTSTAASLCLSLSLSLSVSVCLSVCWFFSLFLFCFVFFWGVVLGFFLGSCFGFFFDFCWMCLVCCCTVSLARWIRQHTPRPASRCVWCCLVSCFCLVFFGFCCSNFASLSLPLSPLTHSLCRSLGLTCLWYAQLRPSFMTI